MFKQKNVLISLAVALLISACGGGGGGSGDGATTPPPSNNQPPATGTTPPPASVDESVMSGNLQLVAPAVLINGIAINVNQFEPNTTLADGAGPFAHGTNAPIQTFGLRVSPEGMSADGAGQTKRVRVAMDMTEEAGTVSSGQEAEILQFMIDQVDLGVSATSELSVTIPSTARIFVYVKNGSGATANLTATEVPATAVRLVDIEGDSTSKALTVDLDAIFTRLLEAAQGDTARLAVLNSVKDFSGTFGTSKTISNVVIQKEDDSPATGAAITVTGSSQPAVNGAGLVGRLQVLSR